MSTRATPKSVPKGVPSPKPRATPAKAVQPAAEADDEVEAAADDASAPAAAGGLKLRELVARVVEATGAKKKDARSIVEATLMQLGEALAKGEELNLPGMGKVRVARNIDKDGRAMLTLKVRGPAAPKKKEPKEALAEAEEGV